MVSFQSPQDSNVLVVPEEIRNYITCISTNDTLKITFDNLKLKEKYYPEDDLEDSCYVVSGVNMRLNTRSADIVSNLNFIDFEIEGIKTDHIKVNAYNSTTIKSCEAETLTSFRQKRFRMEDSIVKTFDLDLNLLSSWDITNCFIEKENLRGKGYHHVSLPRTEAEEMVWYPEDKNSSLVLTLYGDTAKVVFNK
ncbi:MAG: hypothetical protein LIO93_07660 [Bacteroidales bacterium]|nr:hypothetical protein [Bacteroidales bacterium]